MMLSLSMNIHPELLMELADGVLELAIHRPARKNALHGSLYHAIEQALDEANRIPAIKVVILRGAGSDFTAGNDLQDFGASAELGLNAPPFRLLRAVHTFKKPLILAVRGVAVGIGTTLLLHADLAYSDKSARFQLPFTTLALSPEGAASLLLPKQIGHVKATELLLLGEPFNADMAEKLGLLNDIIEFDVYEHARQKARQLAKLPSCSIQVTKSLLKGTEFINTSNRINEEARIFLERMESPEFAEALSAFSQKRSPDFSKSV